MPVLTFPRPEDVVEQIQQLAQLYLEPRDGITLVAIMVKLQVFQADTIYAFADLLLMEARKLELTKATFTADQLKEAGQKLLDYAQTLAPRPDPEAQIQ